MGNTDASTGAGEFARMAAAFGLRDNEVDEHGAVAPTPRLPSSDFTSTRTQIARRNAGSMELWGGLGFVALAGVTIAALMAWPQLHPLSPVGVQPTVASRHSPAAEIAAKAQAARLTKPKIAVASSAPLSPAPATVPKADALVLPVGAPAALFLVYRGNDAEASIRAARMARRLQLDPNLISVRLQPSAQITKPSIGYYFVEDRPSAEAVANRLGMATDQVTLLPARADTPAWPGAIIVTLP